MFREITKLKAFSDYMDGKDVYYLTAGTGTGSIEEVEDLGTLSFKEYRRNDSIRYVYDDGNEIPDDIENGLITTADDLTYKSTYGYSTVGEALDNILDTVNYEAPSITSFEVAPSTLQYEIGSTISRLTFVWEYNKSITAQSLTDCALSDTLTRYAVYDKELSSTKTFTLTATDGTNTVSQSKTVSFLNKKYYGVGTIPSAYDSSFVLGLNSAFATNRAGNITVNPGGGQYIFFCIPTTFGLATFTTNGFVGGFDLVDTINFTNASGYTTSYYIYKSTEPNLGNTTITVS